MKNKKIMISTYSIHKSIDFCLMIFQIYVFRTAWTNIWKERRPPLRKFWLKKRPSWTQSPPKWSESKKFCMENSATKSISMPMNEIYQCFVFCLNFAWFWNLKAFPYKNQSYKVYFSSCEMCSLFTSIHILLMTFFFCFSLSRMAPPANVSPQIPITNKNGRKKIILEIRNIECSVSFSPS